LEIAEEGPDVLPSVALKHMTDADQDLNLAIQDVAREIATPLQALSSELEIVEMRQTSDSLTRHRLLTNRSLAHEINRANLTRLEIGRLFLTSASLGDKTPAAHELLDALQESASAIEHCVSRYIDEGEPVHKIARMRRARIQLESVIARARIHLNGADGVGPTEFVGTVENSRRAKQAQGLWAA
jgi:signal transduction histidine kinase